jgi:hypothetical protein
MIKRYVIECTRCESIFAATEDCGDEYDAAVEAKESGWGNFKDYEYSQKHLTCPKCTSD